MPLISDKEGFHILSLLFQEGAQKADEIGKLLDMPGDQVKTKVRELYQSNYIEVLKDDYLGLTKQAEMLLSILGVPEIAAASLLHDFDIPNWKSAFLQACIEARSTLDRPRARIYFYQLKTVSLALSALKTKEKDLPSLQPKLLFAIIVGLDPHSHRLGSEEYYNEVFTWHSTQSSELWLKMGEVLQKHRKSLVNDCREALSYAVESDRLFFQEAPTKKVSDVTYLTTAIRMLMTLLFDVPDPVLKSALLHNPELSGGIWRRLKLWKADVEKWVAKIVRSQRLQLHAGLASNSSVKENIMDGLQSMLEMSLLESSLSNKGKQPREQAKKTHLKDNLKTSKSNKSKK
jgi:hypothetical protein